MTRAIYSEYVNNYEAASEHIRENENSKPALKDFLMVTLFQTLGIVKAGCYFNSGPLVKLRSK